MTKQRLAELLMLEGQRVHVALCDGSRLDDCQLVSTGRGRMSSMWLFADGEDVFVEISEILDVWESSGASRAA